MTTRPEVNELRFNYTNKFDQSGYIKMSIYFGDKTINMATYGFNEDYNKTYLNKKEVKQLIESLSEWLEKQK